MRIGCTSRCCVLCLRLARLARLLCLGCSHLKRLRGHLRTHVGVIEVVGLVLDSLMLLMRGGLVLS